MAGIDLNQHFSFTAKPENEHSEFKKELFNPRKFFTPGWNGESLVSKPGLQVKKVLFKVQKDVLKQFEKLEHVNRTRKEDIFDEFLNFCHEYSYAPQGLETPEQFWSNLFHAGSREVKYLKKFKHIITFRIAVIYLLKIRFLKEISDLSGLSLEATHLLNPNASFTALLPNSNSFHSKIFAFKGNAYSWYRPNYSIIDDVLDTLSYFSQISQTELVKIFRVEDPTDKCGKDRMDHFSHSLSHVNFGNFLNTVISKFPKWMDGRNTPPMGPHCDLEGQVIDCKLSGDHLEAVAQSLWLSQRQKLQSSSCPTLLVPNFIGNDFHSGLFLKICSQLQFVIQYLRFAGANDISPTAFLSKLFKHSFRPVQSPESMFQFSLFSDSEISEGSTYFNNIVLNLSHFPKNNPHFYLLNQIQSQLSELNENGYLYVFTNKKFFVPSQSEKIEQLLKQAQLIASINLENLKGKGEVSSHLYVFRKIDSEKAKRSKNLDFIEMPQSIGLQSEKSPCLNFRISGHLNSFYKFSVIDKEIRYFFKNKNVSATPIYQKELDRDLNFEFFKDAIIDGRLINSSSKDSSQITHPFFFKKLLRTCDPFGNLFTTELLANDYELKRKAAQTSFAAANWLGGAASIEDSYSAILVVDFRKSHLPRLEVIGVEAYKGKANEYGYALCQYYGLIPKQERININLLREFFDSAMGQQIIQLCLTGGTSKMKSKLQSLLVPKFFLETKELPEHVSANLSFVFSTKEQLLEFGPDKLVENFDRIEQFIHMLLKQYPWAILSILSQFKSQVNDCAGSLNSPHLAQNSLNFNNPVLRAALLNCPLQPIFPNNEDFFVEFNNFQPEELSLPLENITLQQTGEDSLEEGHFLNLSSGGQCLVRIYGDKLLLEFLKYLISNFHGVAIAQILQGIKSPGKEDFVQCTSRFTQTSKSFKALDQKIAGIIANTFSSYISK